MITWKDFVTKKANWLTDTLIVNPLTARFRNQYEEFKKQQANQKTQNTGTAPAPSTRPGTATSGSKDELTRLAQLKSDAYKRWSPARPKIYHGGEAVAR